MNTLTRRQTEVICFLRDHIQTEGYAPSLREIAAAMDVTTSTVQQYLDALDRKGAISRQYYGHRSIEITHPQFRPDNNQDHEIPLRGRIAAGSPIEAIETPDTIDVGGMLGLQGSGSLFALQVDGNSMIEEGIHDGDYVIVEEASVAHNGETVVALLPDGEATLKKFYREEGRVRLQPANPDFDPIYPDQVTIQGRVRGVIRVM